MVFVVARYLPGRIGSDVRRGLSRLEPADAVPEVRYPGSTIWLRDEGRFCQFEGHRCRGKS